MQIALSSVPSASWTTVNRKLFVKCFFHLTPILSSQPLGTCSISGDKADTVDFDLGTLMVPNAVAMSVGMCLSLHAFISTGKLSQTVLCVAMEIKNCCCKWCWRKLDRSYKILSELQGEELSCSGELLAPTGHPSCHPLWMGVSWRLVHICPGEMLGRPLRQP